MTGLYTMPMAFIAIAFKGRWILGDAMCQLGGFIDQLTICAGMVTLGMTRFVLNVTQVILEGAIELSPELNIATTF